MKYACPACRRDLLSRELPLCAFCGAKIPVELLLSREEKALLDVTERRARAGLEAGRAKGRTHDAGVWPLYVGDTTMGSHCDGSSGGDCGGGDGGGGGGGGE